MYAYTCVYTTYCIYIKLISSADVPLYLFVQLATAGNHIANYFSSFYDLICFENLKAKIKLSHIKILFLPQKIIIRFYYKYHSIICAIGKQCHIILKLIWFTWTKCTGSATTESGIYSYQWTSIYKILDPSVKKK
jgi:hypothetical protein